MRKLLIVSLMLLLMGCGSSTALVRDCHNGLMVAGQGYNAAGDIVHDLSQRGQLSDEAKADWIRYGRQFNIVYHRAVSLLSAYSNCSDGELKGEYEIALRVAVNECMGIAGDIIEFQATLEEVGHE
ncbi:hypothetical protein N9104_01720 [Pseudomonadales bacterium]|nr:hypothetical protein [Pseudomonadales bacterium]